MGYSAWSHRESDKTEQLTLPHSLSDLYYRGKKKSKLLLFMSPLSAYDLKNFILRESLIIKMTSWL